MVAKTPSQPIRLPVEFHDIYPFESRYFEVRPGIRMHYIEEGDGEPIIMVHGNPTWSFFYRHAAEKLRETFKVIVPDHVGCGLSDKPGDDDYTYTLQHRIDDLAGLVEHRIGDAPYRLVVHDWGGMIGLGTALRHPDRLQQLVVLNTAGFLLPDDRPFHRVLRFARTGAGGCLIRCFNAFVRGTLRWGVTSGSLNATVRRCYMAPYNSFKNRIAVQRFVQDIPLHRGDPAYDAARYIDDHLGELADVPTTIIWGARDFIFDDTFLAQWRRRCPDARIHTLASAGHLVLEDAPETAVNTMEAFFTGTETDR